jgi:hypothetical protein
MAKRKEQSAKRNSQGAKHKIANSDAPKADDRTHNLRSISRFALSSLPFANRASLWRVRLSITLTREKFGLEVKEFTFSRSTRERKRTAAGAQ